MPGPEVSKLEREKAVGMAVELFDLHDGKKEKTKTERVGELYNFTCRNSAKFHVEYAIEQCCLYGIVHFFPLFSLSYL